MKTIERELWKTERLGSLERRERAISLFDCSIIYKKKTTPDTAVILFISGQPRAGAHIWCQILSAIIYDSLAD